MKKITILCLFFLYSLVATSQEMRFVRGVVLGKNKQPLSGITVRANNTNVKVVSKHDGTFEMKLPFYTTKLQASKGKERVSAKVDGGYIVLRLPILTNKNNTTELGHKTDVEPNTIPIIDSVKDEKELAGTIANVEMKGVAIAVNCKSGMMTYRGVDVATGEELFSYGPIVGTTEIGEFLAVVHALTYMNSTNSKLQVFLENEYIISWVKKKKCKAPIPENATEQLLRAIDHSEKWLRYNSYNNSLIMWDSYELGKNPASIE